MTTLVNILRGLFTKQSTFKSENAVRDYIKTHPKQTSPCKIYNLVLRRTDSKGVIRALIEAGFTKEHSLRIAKLVMFENIIIAQVHYERAEHMADILSREDRSLRVTITEI